MQADQGLAFAAPASSKVRFAAVKHDALDTLSEKNIAPTGLRRL